MSGRNFKSLALCLVLMCGNACLAAAGDYALSGYVKSYFYLFQPASVETAAGNDSGTSEEGMSSNRFRLQASYSPNARIRLAAAYDVAPRIQSESLSGNSPFFGRIDPFSYRAADLDPSLYSSQGNDQGRFIIGQNLDRASLTLRLQSADITIGRQAIAWGSARVINPTDVLAPFTFETLDTEDRIGIDAVRARIPLGALSEIDLGYVFGKDFKFADSAFFARAGWNAYRTDISLLFMGFRENLLVGLDLARPVGGAGYWLEAAYVSADFFSDVRENAARDYFRASTGMDYNLTARVYGFLEYHYNGAGAAHPGDYLGRYTETAYTEGSVYLMGRHYLIPGLVYQCSPLLTLTGQVLINAADPSAFIAPQVEYNIAENAYLGAGAFIGIGKGPAAGGLQSPIVLRSEFGGYPNIYFASLRYYF